MSDLASLEAPIRYLDPPNKSLQNMSHYGGFFDALAEAASRWSPLGHYETRHLVNALFGMVGVLSAYLLARSLAGTVAGLLAALFGRQVPRCGAAGIVGARVRAMGDGTSGIGTDLQRATLCGSLSRLWGKRVSRHVAVVARRYAESVAPSTLGASGHGVIPLELPGALRR